MTFIKIICDMKNWIFAALLLTLLACRGNAPKNDEQPAADASDESEMALEEQGHGKAFDEGDAEWEEYQRQAPDDEEFTLTPQRHKRTIEDYVADFARHYAERNAACREVSKGNVGKKEGQVFVETNADKTFQLCAFDSYVARFRYWKSDDDADVLCAYLSDWTATGPDRERMDFWYIRDDKAMPLSCEFMVPGINLNERVELDDTIGVYYSDSQTYPDEIYVWNGTNRFIHKNFQEPVD